MEASSDPTDSSPLVHERGEDLGSRACRVRNRRSVGRTLTSLQFILLLPTPLLQAFEERGDIYFAGDETVRLLAERTHTFKVPSSKRRDSTLQHVFLIN